MRGIAARGRRKSISVDGHLQSTLGQFHAARFTMAWAVGSLHATTTFVEVMLAVALLDTGSVDLPRIR